MVDRLNCKNALVTGGENVNFDFVGYRDSSDICMLLGDCRRVPVAAPPARSTKIPGCDRAVQI